MAKHPDDTQARVMLSEVLRQEKKFEQAADVLGNSDDPRVVGQKVQLLIQGGKFDAAEKLLAPVIASGHAPIDLLGQMGYIDTKLHRPKQAVEVLNQGLAQEPKNPQLLMYRATALLDLPQPNLDDLINDLIVVRQAMPNLLDARGLLVECYR